jgi:hypothetical protein
MNLILPIPDDLGERLSAGGTDLARRALEAFAAEEYSAGRLTLAELGRLLEFETRPPLRCITALDTCQASHRRAQHPWRELRGAEVELLALRSLARRHAQHQLEDALAALLHALIAVEDRAAVHVHVVCHP